MAVALQRAAEPRLLRFELRWARVGLEESGFNLPKDAPFCSVRCAVFVDAATTVGELRVSVASCLTSLWGTALTGSEGLVLESLRRSVTTVDDFSLFAPVATHDGGSVAAVPLTVPTQLARDALPLSCFTSPQHHAEASYNAIWTDASEPESVLSAVQAVHSTQRRAPYNDIEARINAALEATPQVRALSNAMLVRLNRDIEPVLIYDPLVLAKVLEGTTVSEALRILATQHEAEEMAREIADNADGKRLFSPPPRTADPDMEDPAELIRRDMAALRHKLTRRKTDPNASDTSLSSTDGGVTGGTIPGHTPSWWRLASHDGSDGLVTVHARLPGEEKLGLRRRTHVTCEYVFEHGSTGERLLSTIADVARPSAHTAATVEALHRYLQPYAEIAAEEHRLSGAAVNIIRCEYLDADFATFVLVTPTSAPNAIHPHTRALRITAALSFPSHRSVVQGDLARRAELDAVPLRTVQPVVRLS
jgi:hypothetical protein